MSVLSRHTMRNLRKYGKAPRSVALVHGGPGAGGEMAPVARELAARRGILEPIQTATSVAGQVEELRTVLERHGDAPVTLVGFSWGAWLSTLVAAHYPAIVRRLILIGGGPYQDQYVAGLGETRRNRLREAERWEYDAIVMALQDPATQDEDRVLARLGVLTSKTDSYDPAPGGAAEAIAVDHPGERFRRVWSEAADMRTSGELLRLAGQVRCPVTAIHGEYDPHPAEGVRKPLSAVLKSFQFHLLKNCGHTPWIERQAKTEFYRVLEEALH